MLKVIQRTLQVTIIQACITSGLASALAKHNTAFFLNTEVTFNPDHVQDHRLVISQDSTTLDVILNISHDYTQDSWVTFVIGSQNGKSKRYRNIFRLENNVCLLLGSKGGNFITMWVQNSWKSGNLPKSCPMKKGNYSWHKLNLESLNIPKLFVGKYNLNVMTYFRRAAVKEILTNITVVWEIK